MVLRRVLAVLAALFLVAATLTPAQAVSWSYFYKSGEAPVNTWKSKTPSGPAKYNRANVRTFEGDDPAGFGATAYVKVAYVGSSSSGSGNVSMSFAYTGAKFSCKWGWAGGYGRGRLLCRWGYT